MFSNPALGAEIYTGPRQTISERRITEKASLLRCRDKVMPKNKAEPEQRMSARCLAPDTDLMNSSNLLVGGRSRERELF